jgi:hypothetical protein
VSPEATHPTWAGPDTQRSLAPNRAGVNPNPQTRADVLRNFQDIDWPPGSIKAFELEGVAYTHFTGENISELEKLVRALTPGGTISIDTGTAAAVQELRGKLEQLGLHVEVRPPIPGTSKDQIIVATKPR